MALRVINAAEVRELLSMAECIDAMADAMRAASAGTVAVPARLVMPLVDDSGCFFLMPGSAADPAVYGAKLISLHPANPGCGRPLIQGFVSLFDHETGEPLAILAGGEITAIRTAAASGLATRHLARTDAETHGIFGTGVQAITHIDAVAAVRPIKTVWVWGRDANKTGAFAAEQADRTKGNIRATNDPRQAAACDVVSTVTASPEPVLRGNWVQAGSHINLVGAHTPATREADSDLIARSAVYTDLLASALRESGDILIPIEEGRIHAGHLRGEIGRVVSGELPGRRDDREITVYKSLGITAQDLFAAELVYRKALSHGVGVEVAI